MAIPSVDAQRVLEALREFDEVLRVTPEFSSWEEHPSQSWVLKHEGKRYPPKKIVSLAARIPVDSFSGGPETNNYLAARGFAVGRLREVSLAETFKTILERYRTLRTSTPFGGNAEAKELFTTARRVIEEWLPSDSVSQLEVVASYGKGNWATIPWISVLDRRETRTTQDGTYVVYLFREDGRGVVVKLGQGVTKVEQELGAEAVEVLAQRAAALRPLCEGLQERGFSLSGEAPLGTVHRSAKLYEASTIASKTYDKDAIPPDDALREDLLHLLERYKQHVDQRVRERGLVRDTRPLALIGTWRGIQKDISTLKERVARQGGVASWWSFPIKEEAKGRLRTPFNLYAYDGRVYARLRVDECVTSTGSAGLESPWPDMTDPVHANKRRLGDKQSEIFKTWFRITAVEPCIPPKFVDSFDLALGLSTPESVLNQNTFGYVIEDEAVPPAEIHGTLESESSPPALLPQADLTPRPRRDSPNTFTLAWLSETTGLDPDQLAEIIGALRGASPQIMLAGPPGTSKTWIARQLATYLTSGDPSRNRFVQFHPSYSYESFIEGLRPVTREGTIHFERTPGVVKELVESMTRDGLASDPDTDYVIVIDEANRANLPRVLGELMFLFEYRDESIRLQHSDEFKLPSNLRFIGTMNTADRSIRSIDMALRRRFEVFELGPDVNILERHYATQNDLQVEGLLDGFAALNQALADSIDRHHTVGHAFFMRPRLDVPALRAIWQRKVFPLVEEFFFDQPEMTAQFTLERFWPAAGKNA